MSQTLNYKKRRFFFSAPFGVVTMFTVSSFGVRQFWQLGLAYVIAAVLASLLFNRLNRV